MKAIKQELDEVKAEMQGAQQDSWAMSILQDYKKQTKRQFVVILVILTLWFVTIGYLVWFINDTNTIEETMVTQENDNGHNNYIGNDGTINNDKVRIY